MRDELGMGKRAWIDNRLEDFWEGKGDRQGWQVKR